MPFIPHTEADVLLMLQAIGASSIEDLFEEIPAGLKDARLDRVPPGLTEMEVLRLMQERAEADGRYLSFIGAGAYEHHIPAAVWQLATRGEFYSSYTPYQAEASQGTLQVLYEYQTMMSSLTGLDVTNASLYDGASALAEAVLMAVRLHKSSHRVLLPATLHPVYRDVVRSIVSNQEIELVTVPYCTEKGTTLPEALSRFEGQEFAALVVPQPNFFGALEPVHALTDWTHQQGALMIASVNPVALGLLAPPGRWGARGADIAVGEGQPLGVPLAAGGPYFGFMACKQAHVRQMPGRIVGRTSDVDGKPGFTLTLQAREQHIRRSKATSNICTNQGLAVTAATIHLALLGPNGLKRVAHVCHNNLLALLERLKGVPGVARRFAAPVFHEAVLSLSACSTHVLERMREQRLLAGIELREFYPELGDAVLVCTTETKTQADLDRYARSLAAAHSAQLDAAG
ncbi:MAG TPA: aminomethyl-transferring glycine dehydrogenase subunit GcvPA [Burkholderiales bacterium]|nr:aminomethyl-transferring glycine dehydrogenase subunit GcvPA [Burkholderiales bacterium]